MNLNKIFLSAFLVPFVLVSNSNINERIENLKKNLHEKELELSNLGKMIAEKEASIDSIRSAGITVYSSISNTLNEQEEKELNEKLDIFEENIIRALNAKNDLKNILITDFSNNHKNTNNELARIKSVIIRQCVEYHFLKRLFKHYEECLQELIAIEHELNKLQK